MDGEAWHAAFHGVTESDTTEEQQQHRLLGLGQSELGQPRSMRGVNLRKGWGAPLRGEQPKRSCRDSKEPPGCSSQPKTSDKFAQGLLEAVIFRSVSVLTAGQEAGILTGNMRWLEGVAPQMVQDKFKTSIPAAVDAL